MEDIINTLDKNKYEIRKDVSFKELTTYKAGGSCKYLVLPKDLLSLKELIKLLKENNIKYKVFGNGSNILASDKIYDGVIIKLDYFNYLEENDEILTVGSGYKLVPLSIYCANKGLAGLEFASGIPGSVGGAVYMNAGAYLSDISSVLEKIKVLDEDLEVKELRNEDLLFSYRSSDLMGKNIIVLEATFKLKKDDSNKLLEIIKDRKERRLKTQPLDYPSAGSVFRNPTNDYAGRLVEDSKLKGYVLGGAKISEMHANFIINYNNATSNDIKNLIFLAKESVLKNFGVELKIEQELFNWE